MCPPFFPAALVLTRVVSHPHNSRVTCDAGHKSLSADAVVPTCAVVGHAELTPLNPSEEHLPLGLREEMSRPQVGEVLYLLPHHSFPTANNFDFALLEQNSKIMSIEEVSARGREAPLLGRANGTTSPVRAFHHHQPETESAVDLLTDVLPVRRRRKLHHRVTRSGDRPYQLQAFLGKPVPGSAHRRGLRSHAGVTLAGCRDRLCSSPGLHVARTVAQARSPGTSVGTTYRRAPANVVSLSTHFHSHRHEFRSSERIDLSLSFYRPEIDLVASLTEVCRNPSKSAYRSN